MARGENVNMQITLGAALPLQAAETRRNQKVEAQ